MPPLPCHHGHVAAIRHVLSVPRPEPTAPTRPDAHLPCYHRAHPKPSLRHAGVPAAGAASSAQSWRAGDVLRERGGAHVGFSARLRGRRSVRPTAGTSPCRRNHAITWLIHEQPCCSTPFHAGQPSDGPQRHHRTAAAAAPYPACPERSNYPLHVASRLSAFSPQHALLRGSDITDAGYRGCVLMHRHRSWQVQPALNWSVCATCVRQPKL